MKRVNILIVMLVISYIFSSCVREYKEEGTNNATAPRTAKKAQNMGAEKVASTSAKTAGTAEANYTIDRKANYYQELRKGLGLTRPQMNQVKDIAEKYRVRIKDAGPTTKQGIALKAERNNKFLTVLSKAQLDQKKYIDAVYFGFSTESPAHPVNLKKALSLSDSKVLQILSVQNDFKAVRDRLGKNIDAKNPQLMKALERRNTALQQILSPEQFAQYRKAMKAAYSVAG